MRGSTRRWPVVQLDSIRSSRIAGWGLESPRGHPSNDEGAVWLVDAGGLAWIDPKTNDIVGRLDLGWLRGPPDLAVGEGTAWVTSMNDARARRIDLR